MANIANLVVEISAKSTQLKKGLSAATLSVTQFAKSSAATLSKIGLALSAAFTVAAAVIINTINKTADQIDVLAKSAANLGVTVASLQELRFAANLAGVSNEQLGNSLKRLQKSVFDANNGLSTAKRAFDAIGVSLEDLNGLDPAAQFALVGKAIGQVKDQTTAAGAAMDIFGKSGAANLALFRSDITATINEFKAFDISLSQSQAKATETFNDAATEFGTLWLGFKQQVTANVAPAFTAIIKFIQQTILNMGGIRKVAIDVATGLINMAVSAVQAIGKIPELFALAESAGLRFDQLVLQLNIRLTKLRLTALNVGNAVGFALGGEFGAVLTENVIQAEKDLMLLESQSKKTADQIKMMMEAAENSSTTSTLQGLVSTLEQARANIAETAASPNLLTDSNASAAQKVGSTAQPATAASRRVGLKDVQDTVLNRNNVQPAVNISVDAKTRELFNFIVENPNFVDRVNSRVDQRTENARRRITR